MNNQIKLFIMLILLNSSCSSGFGIEKLGEKIYLDNNLIILTETDGYRGIGSCIIPPTVEKVKKDEKFVIVLTLNGRHKLKYWLIDKTIQGKELNQVNQDSVYWYYTKFSNVYGPLDSIDFEDLKKEKGVELNW